MLNHLNRHLLNQPSLRRAYCVVCGKPANNQHHVIIKGMGGTKYAKQIPTVSLCGMGNASGCHGLAHTGRLFFDYRDGWYYCQVREPITYEIALEYGEWEPCLK